MRASTLLLLLSLFALPLSAWAQGTVHRCIDAHGNPLFTDQPCMALQATPVTAPAASSSSAPSPGAPVPLQRCAASPDALRQRVIAAFAAHDPNRLAGLMLWHGYGHASAVDDIRTLAALVRQPLLQVHMPGNTPAASASSVATPAALAPDTLELQTSSGQRVGFAITHEAGCLWLRYAD